MVSVLVFVFTSCILHTGAYRKKTGHNNLHKINEDDTASDRIGPFGRLCPVELVTNETQETCIYRGEMLDDPDQTMTSSWAGGSRHPLVFTAWGGLQNIQSDLMHELHFMMSERAFVRSLTHMVAMNRSHAEMIHHGAHRSFEFLAASIERDAENLEPVEFAATQTVHHVVESALDEALHAGLVAVGNAGVGGIAIQGAIGLLNIAGPVLLGVETYHLAHHLRHHLVTKDQHAREFAMALVAKSDCIRSKVTLTHEQVFDANDHIFPKFFIPEFDEVCGIDVGMALGSQMIKTNEAMLAVFQRLKGIGKCLFPEGSRAWSKSNCVAAIDDNLHSHEGQPGLLASSLALAAAYSHESDQVLSEKKYADWFETYFNVSSPMFSSNNIRSDLIRLKARGAPVEERAQSCLSIVGLHRAFERTFVRLKTALNVYMHSFVRDALHWSFRTSNHPCRRVVKAFGDRTVGLCMSGEDKPAVLSDSAWVQDHIEHVTEMPIDEVGECVEDANPGLHLSIFNEGQMEGDEHEEH